MSEERFEFSLNIEGIEAVKKFIKENTDEDGMVDVTKMVKRLRITPEFLLEMREK